MSIQRQSEKTRVWREWLRRHRSVLSTCGLPPGALRSELDWFVFLDHGHVQSATEPPADWWSIRLLAAAQAGRLAGFIKCQYPGRYTSLVAELRRLSGGQWRAEPGAPADARD